MRTDGLFPQEVVSDVPCVTMTGSQTVHIEQHKGLIAYQPEEVAFRTTLGALKICGVNLHFKLYTSTEAVLVGQISSMILSEQGGVKG